MVETEATKNITRLKTIIRMAWANPYDCKIEDDSNMNVIQVWRWLKL